MGAVSVALLIVNVTSAEPITASFVCTVVRLPFCAPSTVTVPLGQWIFSP